MVNAIPVLLEAIIQLLIFSLIPFVFWIMSRRSEVSFPKWLGFIEPKIENRKQLVIVIVVTAVIIPVVQLFILPSYLGSADLATSQFAGTGFSMILAIIFYAFIQTALSEEILFRGFLGKRLINKFGFQTGNLIQALLFGLLHGAIFVPITGLTGAKLITGLITLDGWLLGYMNEKLAGESIIPSWLLHGILNVAVSLSAAFNLI